VKAGPSTIRSRDASIAGGPFPHFSSRAGETAKLGLREADKAPDRPHVIRECRFGGLRSAPDASSDCRWLNGMWPHAAADHANAKRNRVGLRHGEALDLMNLAA
jgi:hypothetical protein